MQQRRFINQAIFEKIWIGHEDVENADLKQPFDAIRVVSEATRIVDLAAARQEIEAGKGAENGKAPVLNEEPGALALGSISTSMVELVGLEPTTSTVPR